MGFLIFFIKRALATIPLLIAITLVAFILVQAMPGDYADQWKNQTMMLGGISEEEAEIQAQDLRKKLGLDKPVFIQYLIWVKDVTLYWDLGDSFVQNRPVNDVVGDRIPRTLLLAFICYFNAVTIGILAGVYAATHQYQIGDQIATVLTFLAFSIPKFIIAIFILYFWAIKFHSPYYGSLFSQEYVLQEGWWSLAKTWDFFLHTWPIIAVGSFVGAGYQMRMMRGNLLDVLKMQFIETARAKGLKESKIVWKHGVPNALHPIIMNQGRSVSYLIEGEIEVAIVLAIPTVGPLILSSVSSMDIYVASSIFMILSLVLVVGNFIADCFLALLDPRIRDMSGGAA